MVDLTEQAIFHKQCIRCGNSYHLLEFSPYRVKETFYITVCKKCNSEANSKYRNENKDKLKETRDKFNLNHPNYGKEQYHKHKHKYIEKHKTKEFREQRKIRRNLEKNKLKEKLFAKEYNKRPERIEKRRIGDRKRNKNLDRKLKRRFYSSQRKKRVKRATPSWINKQHKKQIKEFYDKSYLLFLETGEKFHVDHIIPLGGKLVSGLNVPWNLQLLNEVENERKNNKFDGTYDNKNWREQ